MNAFHYDRSQSLGHLTGIANRLLNGELAKRFSAAGFELTAEQWAALVILWNNGDATNQELAMDLRLEKSSVSRLVAGLERRGLVRREPDPSDGRQKRIRPTRRAMELRDESVRIAGGLLEDAQRNVTRDELLFCRSILTRVIANLGGETPEGDA